MRKPLAARTVSVGELLMSGSSELVTRALIETDLEKLSRSMLRSLWTYLDYRKKIAMCAYNLELIQREVCRRYFDGEV